LCSQIKKIKRSKLKSKQNERLTITKILKSKLVPRATVRLKKARDPKKQKEEKKMVKKRKKNEKSKK